MCVTVVGKIPSQESGCLITVLEANLTIIYLFYFIYLVTHKTYTTWTKGVNKINVTRKPNEAWSRQPHEKLQCLYENLVSINFGKTAVLEKKIWIVN